MSLKGLLIVLVLMIAVGGVFTYFLVHGGDNDGRESPPYDDGQISDENGVTDDPGPDGGLPDGADVNGEPSWYGDDSDGGDGGGTTGGVTPTSSGPRDQRPSHLQSTVTAEEVEQAMKDRNDPDPLVREKAMVVISRDREKANEPMFVETLRDKSEDPRVRAQAATGLARIGAIRSVPYLVEAMEDDSEIVRARAYAAFKRLTGRDYGFNPRAPEKQRDSVLARMRQLMPPDWQAPSE